MTNRENVLKLLKMMDMYVMEKVLPNGEEITTMTLHNILDIVDVYNYNVSKELRRELIKGERYNLIKLTDDMTAVMIGTGQVTFISPQDEKYFDSTIGCEKLRIAYHKKCKKFVLSSGRLLHLVLLERGNNVGFDIHHINLVKADNTRKNLIELTKLEHLMVHAYIKSGFDKYDALELVELSREDIKQRLESRVTA
jgi:hypothetical protein